MTFAARDSHSRWTSYDTIRIVLGLLLVAAAGLKAHQFALGTMAMRGILNSRWMVVVVVEIELIVGVWMLSGLYPRISRYAGLLCFGAFLGISVSKVLSGEPSCGCFGALSVSPTIMLFVNGLSIIALTFFKPKSRSLQVSRKWRAAFMMLVLLLLNAIGAAILDHSFATLADDGAIEGDANGVVLIPESWIEKPCPLLHHIDIGSQLQEGDWLVILIRYDCVKCRTLVAAMERGIRPSDERIAVIELNPTSQAPLLSRATELAAGRVMGEREWIVDTPVQLALSGGIVQSVTHPE